MEKPGLHLPVHQTFHPFTQSITTYFFFHVVFFFNLFFMFTVGNRLVNLSSCRSTIGCLEVRLWLLRRVKIRRQPLVEPSDWPPQWLRLSSVKPRVYPPNRAVSSILWKLVFAGLWSNDCPTVQASMRPLATRLLSSLWPSASKRKNKRVCFAHTFSYSTFKYSTPVHWNQ